MPTSILVIKPLNESFEVVINPTSRFNSPMLALKKNPRPDTPSACCGATHIT
jgi:hypothetical protein